MAARRLPQWRRSPGRDRMASRKTLTFQALGAVRLAEILIELATGNTAIKRRLRLSTEVGVETIEVAIGKRLATLHQARSFVDWQRRPAFVNDLDLQRDLAKRRQPAEDQAEKLVAE